MSRTVGVRLAGIVTALLFLAMAVHAAPLRPVIPAIQFTYSEGSFHAILAEWQSAGVARFRMHFAFDFPFLVGYGVFGYLYAMRSRRPLQRSESGTLCFFRWLLPAAALMDAAENLLHLHFIDASTAPPNALYLMAGLIATCKWLLIAVFAIRVVQDRLTARVPA